MKQFYFLAVAALLTLNCSAQGNLPGAGNCLSFNGTSDYVHVKNSGLIYDASNPFTVESWIKPTTITAGEQWIYWEGNTSSNSPLARFGISLSSLCYTFRGNSGGAIQACIPGIVANQWQHVALTRNGTTFILYINGIVVSTNTATMPSPLTRNTSDIGIMNRPSAGGFFNGQIDEVRIWNKALTQTEIRDNLCQKLIGSEAGLVGYWRFDESSGTTANDSSPNGNNGTLK